MHTVNPPQATAYRSHARAMLAEGQAVFSLALPVTAGLLSGVLMTVIDTLMLVPLGAAAVAAVGLATSLFIIVSAALLGFASVFSVGLAQAIGSRNDSKVAQVMGSGLVLTGVTGTVAGILMVLFMPLLVTLAPDETVGTFFQGYWLVLALVAVPHAGLAGARGAYTALGRPWLSVLFTFLGVAANIPLNLMFIHGVGGWSGLGVQGAAWASLAAKALTLVVFAGHFALSPALKRYRHQLIVVKSRVRSDFREGISVALGSVSDGGAYAATGMLIALMGTTALAAHQAVHSVGVLLFMVPIGMMIAVSIRCGRVFGSGHAADLRPLWFAATLLISFWSLLVAGAVILLRHPLAEVLGATPAVSELAALLFLVTVFLQAADGLQSTALGALRGMSDNRIPNLICVLTYWFFALPLAGFLGFWAGFGPAGVLLGYGAGVLLTGGILIRRFLRRTGPFRRNTSAGTIRTFLKSRSRPL